MTSKKLSPLRLKDIETGRRDERAAIVAWMMREEKEYPSTEYNGFVAMIREEIEAGEHLK